MIRVVLDSNIYISALVFGGTPRLVLELAEEGLVELSVSKPICDEVERVLHEKFVWPRARVKEAASHLWSIAGLISPKVRVSDCVDPDDNRVLECALESGAQLIVTGDSHLLALNPYKSIAILSPRQFLESKLWRE